VGRAWGSMLASENLVASFFINVNKSQKMEQNIENNKVNLESGHHFNFSKTCGPLAVIFFLFSTNMHLSVNS